MGLSGYEDWNCSVCKFHPRVKFFSMFCHQLFVRFNLAMPDQVWYTSMADDNKSIYRHFSSNSRSF